MCKSSNAYPASSKGSDFAYTCLRHFVEYRFKNPDTVCRSDAAHDLGWLPETALPRRWPHNSKCERMIRTFVAIKTVEAAAKAKSLRFLQGRAYQCMKFDRFFLRQQTGSDSSDRRINRARLVPGKVPVFTIVATDPYPLTKVKKSQR